MSCSWTFLLGIAGAFVGCLGTATIRPVPAVRTCAMRDVLQAEDCSEQAAASRWLPTRPHSGSRTLSSRKKAAAYTHQTVTFEHGTKLAAACTRPNYSSSSLSTAPDYKMKGQTFSPRSALTTCNLHSLAVLSITPVKLYRPYTCPQSYVARCKQC